MNAMPNEASEHLWFQDRMAAYLAGGLSDQDAQRFEAHAAACGVCAAMLDAMRSADVAMKSLFADAPPPADYEERLVSRFRSAVEARPSRLGRIHPMVRRAAIGVAATLVVGVCGYYGSRGLNGGAQRHTVVASASVKQYYQDMLSYPTNSPLNINTAYGPGTTRPSGGEEFARTMPESLVKGLQGGYDPNRGIPVTYYAAVRVSDDAEKDQKIPYQDILRYPTNWSAISYPVDSSGDGIADGRLTVSSPVAVDRYPTRSLLTSRNPVNNLGWHSDKLDNADAVDHALKKRFDPEGVRNLTWRPGGTTHLDIDAFVDTTSELPSLVADQAHRADTLNFFTRGKTQFGPVTMDQEAKSKGDARTSLNGGTLVSPGPDGVFGTADDIVNNGPAAPSAQRAAGPVVKDNIRNLVTGLAQTSINDFRDAVVNGEAQSHDMSKKMGRVLNEKGLEAAKGASNPNLGPQAMAYSDYFREQKGQADAKDQPSNGPETSDFVASAPAAVPTTPPAQNPPPGATTPIAGKENKITEVAGDFLNMAKSAGPVLSIKHSEHVPEARQYQVSDLLISSNDALPPVALNTDKAVASTPPLQGQGETPKPPATPPVENPAGSGATAVPAQRHVIRNGEVQFEVDSFDSAALQVSKIVGEEGGCVDTTNSEKLPNGKVQGTVIVRVPPENLDVLILKLRGIGDLKSQHIAAQDITKEYTDVESQLRAAQAMETRLLDLIKQGKGEIKDLLAAEKELGVWREKIDAMEGQIRYYNNLISLSTLSVGLMERDIRAAYAALETETVSAGVETENVEKARTDALKVIDEAKGRVIESDLNKLDADQYKGTIVAEVPAEKAGSVIDALRQLGRVARLDVQRKQTTEGGAIPAAMAASLKIERKQTRFDITLYNLANVPARQTVAATLACRDVDKAYHDILAAAEAPDATAPARKVGRVLASNLNTQRAGQVSGVVTLEVRSELAPTMDAILQNAGEVMHLAVTENADANTVTSTKRGYAITLNSLSQVPPREMTALSVAARDVPGFYHKLLDQLQEGKLDSRVINAELNEQDRLRVAGLLEFEIARTDLPVINALLGHSGESDVFERAVTRSQDDQTTVDSKVRLTLRLINADELMPRETTDARIEAADVEQAASDIAAAAQGAGGRTVERRLSKEQGGALEVRMVVEVPLAGAANVLDRLRAAGTVREMTSAKNLQVPDGSLARAQFAITLGNSQLMVTPEGSISARFHDALQTSVKGLLFVLQYLVVGVLLVGPIALVIWGGWRVVGRMRRGAREAKPA